MCMEDIRIGRASGSFAGSMALAADTTTVLLPANLNRTALTFHVRLAVGVLLAFEGQDINNNQGFLMLFDTNPYCFRIEDVGDVLTGVIRVRAIGAPSQVTWIESTLQKR